MDFEQPQRELNQLIVSKTWQNISNYPAILPANLNWIISDFFESSTQKFVASVILRNRNWRYGTCDQRITE